MVRKALEGAKEEGAETHLIHLADLVIEECDGCHACWKGRPCSKKDDMQAIYAEIESADAIVFGTPVYWFGPTALIKAMMDRFVYFNCEENRPKVRGKRAVLLVPFEDRDNGSAAPLVDMFRMSMEYLEISLDQVVLVPGLEKKGAVADRPELMTSIMEAGRSLAR
jgi:multimeric flavodoxin WrbA